MNAIDDDGSSDVNTAVRGMLLGTVAAAAATVAKMKTEQTLQPLAERAFPPKPAAKTAPGADAGGHPENMPPSKLADRLQQVVADDELDDEQQAKVAAGLHWAMGIGFGTAYGLAAARVPAVRAGHGAGAGELLFAAAHGTALPAARLQQAPWRMPAAWWVWEPGSHLVYGVVLDTTLRVLERIAP